MNRQILPLLVAPETRQLGLVLRRIEEFVTSTGLSIGNGSAAYPIAVTYHHRCRILLSLSDANSVHLRL